MSPDLYFIFVSSIPNCCPVTENNTVFGIKPHTTDDEWNDNEILYNKNNST